MQGFRISSMYRCRQIWDNVMILNNIFNLCAQVRWLHRNAVDLRKQGSRQGKCVVHHFVPPFQMPLCHSNFVELYSNWMFHSILVQPSHAEVVTIHYSKVCVLDTNVCFTFLPFNKKFRKCLRNFVKVWRLDGDLPGGKYSNVFLIFSYIFNQVVRVERVFLFMHHMVGWANGG